MVTEDWQSFWAASAARYNAYRNEGGTYNTLNYWTSGIMDAAAAIYRANGYMAQAAWNDPNLYNIANYLTLGLIGQFDKTVNTPISDSDYWRAMRNILSTEAGAIAVYNAFASGIALPTTTEGLIKWGDRYGIPAGVVPKGTFDNVFESNCPNSMLTEEGLDIVRKHLSGDMESPENNAMIERISNALKGNTNLTEADINFYNHEIYESKLMEIGYSYESAHTEALKKYGVIEYELYDPSVIKQYKEYFNENWIKYWEEKNDN